MTTTCKCGHQAEDHGQWGCEHVETGPSVLAVCDCDAGLDATVRAMRPETTIGRGYVACSL